MITKDDVIGHLHQMVRLEEQMEAIYDALQGKLQHAEYKKTFAEMAEAERSHAAQLQALILLFSE